MKKYEEGLKVIEDITELNEKNATILNNKAVLYAALNKKDDAVDLIRSVIKMFPDGNYYDSYGEILMTFQDYEGATKQFQEALNLEPNGWFSYQTHIKMGLCYKGLGNYEKAIEHFKIGKMLTERMLPSMRDVYINQTKDYIKELEQLTNQT